MSGEPKFVMAQDATSNAVQTVTKIAPLETYLCEFKDAEGKTSTRVAFSLPGGETVILLADQIAATPVAAHGTKWFLKAFNDFLGKMSGKSSKLESV